MKRPGLVLALALTLCRCGGTTGGDVIDFPAAAAGPADANPSVPFEFTDDHGWHIVLTTAALHVGAVYLDQSMPVSGAQNTGCVLPGTYVAQVTYGLDVNLLSPTPQRFPAPGHGTTLSALVGQVWLTYGDVNRIAPATPVLHLAGTADKAGDARPFVGTVSISSNRTAATTTRLAGASPICKQRIVSPIPTTVTISHTGGLLLRIDPRFLFVNADLSELGAFSSGYGFSDDPTNADPTSPLYYSQPSANLYQNLHAASGLYTFSWDADL